MDWIDRKVKNQSLSASALFLQIFRLLIYQLTPVLISEINK
jgi:hypothetical protein